jgi:hypothetical protein
MKAQAGQAGIKGFPALESDEWSDLKNPLASTVGIEIA